MSRPQKPKKISVHLLLDEQVVKRIDQHVRARLALEPERGYTRSDYLREAARDALELSDDKVR